MKSREDYIHGGVSNGSFQWKSQLEDLENCIMTQKPTKLACVTAYFNPCNSESRLKNLQTFALNMKDNEIDLHVIEGIDFNNDSKPIVEDSDCNSIHDASFPCTSKMSVYYSDLLFHKERLLNILVRSLPKKYDAVLWADADVLLAGDCLHDKIINELGEYPLIQPWSRCQMLDQYGKPQDWFGKGNVIKSTACHNLNRSPELKDGSPLWSHPGFAWAIRRDVFEEMNGLYEHHITGCADSLMSMAWFGNFKSHYFNGRMSKAMFDHWNKWAAKANQLIQGNIGCIDTKITHLYHGSIKDRQYTMRWKMLATLGYDPESHIEDVGREYPLRWSDVARLEKKSLVQWVESYIGGRKEDE